MRARRHGRPCLGRGLADRSHGGIVIRVRVGQHPLRAPGAPLAGNELGLDRLPGERGGGHLRGGGHGCFSFRVAGGDADGLVLVYQRTGAGADASSYRSVGARLRCGRRPSASNRGACARLGLARRRPTSATVTRTCCPHRFRYPREPETAVLMELLMELCRCPIRNILSVRTGDTTPAPTTGPGRMVPRPISG